MVSIYAKNPLPFSHLSFQLHPILLSLSHLSCIEWTASVAMASSMTSSSGRQRKFAGPATDLLPGLRMEEGDGADVPYNEQL